MTCRGHFTTTNPASISSTEINISSSEKGVLQWQCDAMELARENLLWWMENLKLCNKKKLATGTPYDHSGRYLNKKREAYYKTISTGGNDQRRGSIFYNHSHQDLQPIFYKEYVRLDHSCSGG